MTYTDEWMKLIPKAAKFVCSDFPDIEQADIEQDLWVAVLENPNLDPTREGVSTILVRLARSKAWEYRKEQLVWTSQYSYRTSDLRLILENVYHPECWGSSPIPNDAKSTDKNKVDVFADVSWGIAQLPKQYRKAIETRYRDGVVLPAGAERTKLNRAIRRLADVLNFYRRPTTPQGPGQRKVISNNQARYLLEEQDGSDD